MKIHTSKIIKTEDSRGSTARSFPLRQFVRHSPDDGDSDKDKQKKRAADVAALRIRAEDDARGIIEMAQREAATIMQEAYAAGFAQGEQAGRQRAEAELASLIAAFKNIGAEFEAFKKEFYRRHQGTIIDLAIRIAQKVIHQEVITNREFVAGVVTSAIRLAIDRERLKVRVHPDDVELCHRKRLDIIKHVDGIKQIVFEADETVGRGGAIVESGFGEIDARLDQQLEELESRLRTVEYELEN